MTGAEQHAATIREALTRLTADEHYRSAEENSLHRSALAALDALVAQAQERDEAITSWGNWMREGTEQRQRAEAAEERASQLERVCRDYRLQAEADYRKANADQAELAQARREADQLRDAAQIVVDHAARWSNPFPADIERLRAALADVQAEVVE